MTSVIVPVLEPGILYQIYFEGLKPGTTYSIYVTAGSNHPNFPDLLGSGATVSLESPTRDANDGEDNSSSQIALATLSSMIILLCLLLL